MKKLTVSLATLLIATTAVFAGNYENISIEELKTAIADKSVVVVDVNGTESFTKGHIPTAIDFVAVKDTFSKKLPTDKSTLVVAYCGSESCGAYAAAAKAAKDLGYTNVKHFAPGLKGWKEAGEDLQAVN